MEYYTQLLARYKSRGILIDAKLLLLYFVGRYDSRRILTFERTQAFTVDGFKLLLGVFDYFDRVITTPNILTEVSNLSGKLSAREKPACYSEFATQTMLLKEEYIEGTRVCSLECFKNFHLTDSGIIDVAKGQYLVLTDDWPLAGYLQHVGIDVINFNHIRTLNWDNKTGQSGFSD